MPVRDVPLDIGPEPGNVIGSRRLSSQAATLTVSALTAVKMRFDLNATQKPLLIALVGPACAGGRRRRTQQWDRIPPIRISLCSRQRQGSVARHDKRGYLNYLYDRYNTPNAHLETIWLPCSHEERQLSR
jgi:hypothetical protein